MRSTWLSSRLREIDAMHAKFMQQLVNSAKFNLEHNEEKKVPAYILRHGW
jgi:hypothetical protein